LTTCLLLCALFGYTAFALAKYSPVYTSIRCKSGGSKMEGVHVSLHGITTGGYAVKDCFNPNPYPMVLRQAGEDFAGEVYIENMRHELKSVGVARIPEVRFEPMGRGNLTALLELNVGAWQAVKLLVRNRFNAIAQFKVIAEAHYSFLGALILIMQEQNQACGFEVKMRQKQVGNVVCASNLEDLVIQDSGSTEVVEDTLDMSPEYYISETAKKNRVFGGALAVVFLLAVVTGASGVWLVRRHRAAGGGGARDLGALGAKAETADASDVVVQVAVEDPAPPQQPPQELATRAVPPLAVQAVPRGRTDPLEPPPRGEEVARRAAAPGTKAMPRGSATLVATTLLQRANSAPVWKQEEPQPQDDAPSARRWATEGGGPEEAPAEEEAPGDPMSPEAEVARANAENPAQNSQV